MVSLYGFSVSAWFQRVIGKSNGGAFFLDIQECKSTYNHDAQVLQVWDKNGRVQYARVENESFYERLDLPKCLAAHPGRLYGNPDVWSSIMREETQANVLAFSP